MDQRTLDNIATLIPAAQDKARAFLDAIVESNRLPDGWHVSIISGLRTYAEQDVLYQQGRTSPGPIVTNAPAGYSNHNFGTAFDLGIFNADGQYIDDLPLRRLMTEADVSYFYRMLAPIGKALGLTWGGDWESIDDEPPTNSTSGPSSPKSNASPGCVNSMIAAKRLPDTAAPSCPTSVLAEEKLPDCPLPSAMR